MAAWAEGRLISLRSVCHLFPVVTVEQFIAGVGAMLDEFPGGRCRFMRIGR